MEQCIKRYIKYERYYRNRQPYYVEQELEDIFYPCRNSVQRHLDMIVKAQQVWTEMGQCFKEAAQDWYFTANPLFAFDRYGEPIPGWKIKQCRDKILDLIRRAKSFSHFFCPGNALNGTLVPGSNFQRRINFQNVIDYYLKLLDRFPLIPPPLRRNMESSAQSLTEKYDSQESPPNPTPSRSIDVYPLELEDRTASYIIHADQQHADAALEQPLLTRNTTNEIPHCFSSQLEKFKTNQLEPKVLNHQIRHSMCKVQAHHKIYSSENNK